MQRRDFVRAMIALGIAPELWAQQVANPAPPPPAPVPWTLGLNAKTPLPHTQAADTIASTDPTFFPPSQMDALTHLCDVLMPPLGTKPGALAADTPAFLDFLIGKSPDARKGLYTGGLDWLNSESQKNHRVPFAKLDPTQAHAGHRTLAAHLDGRPSADRIACQLHQRRARGHPDRHHELERLDPGFRSGRSGLGNLRALLVAGRARCLC